MDSLQNMLSRIEDGLLDLKTARQFVGVRTAKYSTSFMATSGKYNIVYASSGPIFSSAYVENLTLDKFVYIAAKTPVGNTQKIDVSIGQGISPNQPIKVVSNIEVLSINPI